MSITKYIPNTITSLNLLCGVLGVIAVFKGFLDQAFYLMLAAAVFDFCDGLAARMLDAYSDMGKELDSLSDMVSFGVLPSLMMFTLSGECCNSLVISLVAVFVAVFSGLRLAKFNVDERQKDAFLGLATPASALLCGSLCCYFCYEPASVIAMWCYGSWFIPAVCITLCVLLVIDLPMFSFKFGKGTKQDRASLFKRLSFIAEIIIIVAFVLIAGHHWSLAFVFSITLYILKNIIYTIFRI